MLRGTGYRDIHSHFIYGVDDGARTQQDMYAMLDSAYRDGISVLYATPHVVPGCEKFPYALFNDHYAEAQAYCTSKGYAMTLYAGAELLYTPSMCRFIEEQQLISMGQTDMVLIEFGTDIPYQELTAVVTSMERVGYTPILAHIERYNCLFHGKNLLRLKEYHDVRFQVNANTLLSKQGLIRGHMISNWLKDELIDFVASDAHNTTSRPYRMRQANRVLKERCRTEYVKALLGCDR